MLNDKPVILGGNNILGSISEWPIITEEDRKDLVNTLDSRNWGLNGNKERLFTKNFIKYIGCKYGHAVANGTVSLEIILRSCEIGLGDEVIVPALTWIATASTVVQVGAKPVFADVSKNSFVIDPKSIEEKITAKTKAIIPVHLHGQPADMESIINIAKKHRLVVIEDCAQAQGAEFKNIKVGNCGHFGSFSFQMAKLMTAGEGGFVTTNEEKYSHLIYSFKNCGRKLNKNDKQILGYNYRMTEFQAGILNRQLEIFEKQSLLRHELGDKLDIELSKIEGIYPVGREAFVTRHGRYRYSFRYSKKLFHGMSLEIFKKSLEAEGCLVHTICTPVYREELFPINTGVTYLENTENIAKEAILLSHQMLINSSIVEKLPIIINRILKNSKEIVEKN
ncbi:MAG: DegT/DnrJ/EryC1/StrS family aminotransferase [Firmicutes bacterium]|nr:DegT/DnrJ/EryC1/StrS family aminotransferase [Bacillota bacterium]